MTNEMFDLTGKVAAITGGSGVLGSAMAIALAKAGAAIVILDRRVEQVPGAIHEIQASGGKAVGITTDVLDMASLESARQRVLDEFGRVDILINAAGGNRPEATVAPGERSFFALPPDALQWVFNLNFMGTVIASQLFGKVMVDQGQGVILNISSMAAFRPLTRIAAYSGAKAAVSNFTQWLAVYMATEHSPAIRVNAIAPGFLLGEQNRFLLLDEKTGELTQRGQQIIAHTPMRRFGDPEDLIGTILWLVSDASRFVTGVVVPIDGGFSAFGGV